MAASKKHSLPPDFINPFEGRDRDEVWKELDKYSKHISREEMFRRFQEQAQPGKSRKKP
jgi:hypothetical protein